jgi:hypothetical protein
MKKPLLKSQEKGSMKLIFAVMTALLLMLSGSQAQAAKTPKCFAQCMAQLISGAYTCVHVCSGKQKPRIIYQSSTDVTCINEKGLMSNKEGVVEGTPTYGFSISGCFEPLIGIIAADGRSIAWTANPGPSRDRTKDTVWVREGCKCQKYKYKP